MAGRSAAEGRPGGRKSHRRMTIAGPITKLAPPGIPETPYEEFLRAKARTAELSGFEIDDAEIHPGLSKPHQRLAVQWAVRGGRRALFEAFGLGKTRQQLEICRLILKRTGGRALITCPLGVWTEF